MSLQETIQTAVILDSNPGLRNELQTELKKHGVKTLKTFSSGKQAYDFLVRNQDQCDLVIADVSLEDASLTQFLANFRKKKRFSQAHVVVFTAASGLDRIPDALPFGISGFAQKPMTGEALCKSLNELFLEFKALKGQLKGLFQLTAARIQTALKNYPLALKYYEELNASQELARAHFEAGCLHGHLKDREKALESFTRAVNLNMLMRDEVAAFVKKNPLPLPKAQALEIPKAAADLFGIPQDRYGDRFYGQEGINSTLVLDASFDERSTLKTVLTGIGLKDVEMEGAGANAINFVAIKRPSLVITSLQLEDMNALQFIDTVRRKSGAGGPLILVIVEPNRTENLPELVRYGANWFLLKPYTGQSLRAALHKMMIAKDLLTLSDKAKPLALLSAVYFDLGDNKRAFQAADKALAIKDEDPLSLFNRAVALHRLGRKDAADIDYSTAAQTPALADMCTRVKREIASDLEAAAKERAELAAAAEAAAREAAAREAAAASVTVKSVEAQSEISPPSERRQTGQTHSLATDEPAASPERAEGSALEFEPGPMASESDGTGESVEFDDEDSDFVPFETLTTPEVDAVDRTLELSLHDSPGLSPLAPSVPSLGVPVKIAASERNSANSLPREPDVSTGRPMASLEESGARESSEYQSPKADPAIFQQEASDWDDSVQGAPRVSELGGGEVSRPDYRLRENSVAVDASGSASAPPRVSSLALAGFKEKIFLTDQTPLASGGIIRVIDSPVIREWLPAAILANMPKPKVSPQIDLAGRLVLPEMTETWRADLDPFKTSLAILARQAQLVDSRIICLPDGHESPATLLTYLEQVGRVMATSSASKILSLESLSKPVVKALKEVKSNPENAAAYRQLGKELIKGGQLDHVFQAVQAYWESKPNHRKRSPKEEEASQTLTQAVVHLQDSILGVHKLFWDGRQRFNEEMAATARVPAQITSDTIDAALRADHFSLNAFKKIYVSLKQSKDEKALSEFVSTYEPIYVRNAQTRDGILDFFERQKDHLRALEIGKEILKQKNGKVAQLKQLAVSAMHLNRYKEAIKYCHRMLYVDKKSEDAYNLLGIIFKKIAKLKKAAGYYKKGIKYNPQSAKLHHNLAITLSALKRPEEARETLQKARGLDRIAKGAPRTTLKKAS